tara:strand:+ start:26350 stop:27219 length:870 start_codon:yes stop_codon:yes gene_type:complete
MKILVIGSNGQLGSEIKEIAVDYKDFNFLFRDLPELNICKKDALNTFILNKNIDLVINCAAYTAVDKAEENAEIAEQVNSLGVQNLVNALEKVNGKLIHISTDYVFDGCNSEPYKESDHVNPLGVYGKTKREGELFVINSSIDSIVIRTSWLYSSFGNNFVKTMHRLGNEKNFLSVISDQIGTPTYARDLAKVCLDIISISDTERISNKGKVYHYSNEGVASWYDFAITIMELSGSNCVIKAIQTIDYPTIAKRPHYSVLDESKIKKDFNIEIPYWKDSLKDCLNKLKQ